MRVMNQNQEKLRIYDEKEGLENGTMIDVSVFGYISNFHHEMTSK
jgi:hypothetical protein